MNNKLLTIMMLLTSIVFCHAQSKTISFQKSDFKGSVNLKGEPLNLGDDLADPTDVQLIGNKLVIDQAFQSPFGLIYDLNTQEVHKFGIIGRGPGEFISPNNITSKTGDPSNFWMTDLTVGKMAEFNINDAQRSEEYRPSTEIRFENANMCSKAVWTSKNMIACLNFDGKGRLTFLDRNGKLVKYVGKLPAPPKSVVTDYVNAFAHSAKIDVKPDGSKIALASRFTDNIQIFDAAGNQVKQLSGPEQFNPRYGLSYDNTGNAFFVPVKDTKIAYQAVATNDNHIFCLYSGRTERKHGDEDLYSKDIFVFDWSGNLVQHIVVDQYLFDLAIDTKGQYFYGLAADGADVYKYYLQLP